MKTLKKSAKLLIAAALVTSVGAASAVNIVQNGSFEAGTFDFGGFGAGTGVTTVGGNNRTGLISNWTVTLNRLIWIQNGYFGNTGQLSASDGARFLDLTALSTGEINYAKIEQTLTTTANTTYALTFDLGSSNAIASGPFGPVEVEVKAGSFSGIVSVPAPIGANLWTTKTIYFTTAGAQTNLAMTIRGVKGDDYIGLDNVRVTAVPEPGSFAMLLAGLAAVGSVASRRRAAR